MRYAHIKAGCKVNNFFRQNGLNFRFFEKKSTNPPNKKIGGTSSDAPPVS